MSHVTEPGSDVSGLELSRRQSGLTAIQLGRKRNWLLRSFLVRDNSSIYSADRDFQGIRTIQTAEKKCSQHKSAAGGGERGRTARQTSGISIDTKMAVPIIVKLIVYDHPTSHSVTK